MNHFPISAHTSHLLTQTLNKLANIQITQIRKIELYSIFILYLHWVPLKCKKGPVPFDQTSVPPPHQLFLYGTV